MFCTSLLFEVCQFLQSKNQLKLLSAFMTLLWYLFFLENLSEYILSNMIFSTYQSSIFHMSLCLLYKLALTTLYHICISLPLTLQPAVHLCIFRRYTLFPSFMIYLKLFDCFKFKLFPRQIANVNRTSINYHLIVWCKWYRNCLFIWTGKFLLTMQSIFCSNNIYS